MNVLRTNKKISFRISSDAIALLQFASQCLLSVQFHFNFGKRTAANEGEKKENLLYDGTDRPNERKIYFWPRALFVERRAIVRTSETTERCEISAVFVCCVCLSTIFFVPHFAFFSPCFRRFFFRFFAQKHCHC